ncbi:MAG TPA: universal stress protein, partial [Gaiellales bacterium]|nr:universal stress protein [Gaiellales bacterium]
METIILAIDGPDSERALPAAQELAKQFMSRIVVVHVNQIIAGTRGGHFSAHVDEDTRVARLHEIVAQLRAEGFDADLELAATSLGHPASIIARKAK